ncbi:MAG: folate family ECF transporter S component [Oscillospiraceae bacterium]|nr:folate family ECF transporter S component [Oscillospiraceae bacterium]
MQNEKRYSSPLCAGYWKEAGTSLRSVRILVVAALCAALSTLFNFFFMVPVGENLNIMFQFLPNAIMGMICGPWVAVLYGVATDFLDFMLHGWGFFPGYTLGSVLGAMIYALFLYRSRVTVLRLFLARLSVNVIVNILLGSLWSAILYGKAYYVYLSASVFKNLILLPLETLILVVVYRMLMVSLVQMGLIPEQPSRRVALV